MVDELVVEGLFLSPGKNFLCAIVIFARGGFSGVATFNMFLTSGEIIGEKPY